MESKLAALPNPQRRAIELVREVAAEKSLKAFLVGGPVRDLLLELHAIDIDVTLEDGASTLARSLAKRVEGRVRSFPQFLTYKVLADGLPDLDIATARTERYRTPGALPAVSVGRLADDLLRRDFSINAMAVNLATGALHDPSGGERDLRSATIRVLHDRSFIDDPTRIFRALRLGGRLHFSLHPATESLLRTSIGEHALETVARERIWRELFLAMDEREAPAILAALRGAGALDLLFGPERDSSTLLRTLQDLQVEIETDSTIDRYVLYTGAFLFDTARSEPQLEGAGFSQKRSKSVLQIAHELPRFERELARSRTEVQRYRFFRTLTSEVLAMLAVHHPDELPVIARYRQYRDFKLSLRGNDLDKVPPGPHVAKALERTREAVYLGEIPARDARSFATGLALKYLSREEQPEKT